MVGDGAHDRRPTTGRLRRILLSTVAWLCAVTLAGCATTIAGSPGRVPGGNVGQTGETDETSTTAPAEASTTSTALMTASPSQPAAAASPSDAASPEPATGPESSAAGTPTTPATIVPVTPDTIATHSIAAVDGHGIITVRAPGDGDRVVIDEYEDPLCPPCGQFDSSYGHQIRDAIENGELTVRYHVAAFLDTRSASGDYSTRAYAAMLALAKVAGTG